MVAATVTPSVSSSTAAATPKPAPSLSSYLSRHPDFRNIDSPSSPLPSLYSSLSSLRSSNAAAYRANLEWWNKILTDVVWQRAQRDDVKGKARQRDGEDRLVLHVDEEMLEGWSFEQVGRPMGIGTVVLDMASTSHLVSLNQFLTSTTAVAGPSRVGTSRSSYIPSARGVVGFVVGKPLWWALSNLGITGGGGGEEDDEDDFKEWRKAKGKWVVWENVERTASAFLQSHYSQATLSPLDSLLPLATFRSRLLSAQPDLSEVDQQIVLRHLCRDKKVARVEKGLVKLAAYEGEEVEAITEQDRGLVAIKETHDRLETQVAELERRMTECDAKVQQHLRASQKPQALNALKLKKHLSSILDKRLDSLSTLSSILLKIEQTAGDASILGTYETATSVLRNLLADPRLQRDRVDSTMEGLEEVVADQKEIDEAIKDGGERARLAAGQEEMDETELKEEMERLEEEERREREEEKQRKIKEEEEAAKEKERERVQRQKEEEERQRLAKEREEAERKRKQKEREEEEKEKELKAKERQQAEAVAEAPHSQPGLPAEKEKEAITTS